MWLLACYTETVNELCYQELKTELEFLEAKETIIRRALVSLQFHCYHANLPIRIVDDAPWCDTCPDCGYVSYCYTGGIAT